MILFRNILQPTDKKKLVGYEFIKSEKSLFNFPPFYLQNPNDKGCLLQLIFCRIKFSELKIIKT